jgi:hypothetical protein
MDRSSTRGTTLGPTPLSTLTGTQLTEKLFSLSSLYLQLANVSQRALA